MGVMLLHACVFYRCNGGVGTVWINICSLYYWLALGRPQAWVIYLSWCFHPQDAGGIGDPTAWRGAAAAADIACRGRGTALILSV